MKPISSFAGDVSFLKECVDVIVLESSNGAQAAVCPAFQGRVMTSASNPNEPGNGWINHDLIASGEILPHIMPYGGEDRLWLGPEGGQYSIFFEPETPFDLAHWQTPAILDTEAFDVKAQAKGEVTLSKQGLLKNYSGFPFHLQLDRTVRMIEDTSALGVDLPSGVAMVAFESENGLTNLGETAWSKDTGLLSLWVLGMLKHSPTTTVIAPIRDGEGPRVNDEYFGKVPSDRLITTPTHVYFRADGKMRTKIGLSPDRAKPVIGSYDPKRGLLTVAQFTLPAGATDYVNSMWEHQENPYSGDVSNSYNDGPPEPGAKPLGPFYELESSSPALALNSGETATHIHRTFHFTGDRESILAIGHQVLGCDLTILEVPDFWLSGT